MEEQASRYKRGVVFYNVSGAFDKRYKHLEYACCRRYRSNGFRNKIINVTLVTFGDDEPIGFTPSINFSKKNVEEFLHTLFKNVEFNK